VGTSPPVAHHLRNETRIRSAKGQVMNDAPIAGGDKKLGAAPTRGELGDLETTIGRTVGEPGRDSRGEQIGPRRSMVVAGSCEMIEAYEANPKCDGKPHNDDRHRRERDEGPALSNSPYPRETQ
jgi:hypothetical protein